MPIVSIEAPAGLSPTKKSKLMQRINTALNDAYEIEDNMIFLREYSRENVAIAGVRQSNAAAPRAHKNPRARNSTSHEKKLPSNPFHSHAPKK